MEHDDINIEFPFSIKLFIGQVVLFNWTFRTREDAVGFYSELTRGSFNKRHGGPPVTTELYENKFNELGAFLLSEIIAKSIFPFPS